jgi:predicted acylesterase/phospholipase RssA
MTPPVTVSNRTGETLPGRFRIALALSGGGFRAAIFHLGVIRRLEELGIMKDVDSISSVSGGSIIAAYYVCEMETRLRPIDPSLWRDAVTRVTIFESIAEDFLKAVDHNLRTRALIFTPFFHPILFIKTLALRAFRVGARSELIQREYDKWFYDGDTIDQLPSVTPDKTHAEEQVLYGPRVILNTTSLLTGERVSFSREPNSAMTEMKLSNKNSLPLSLVVGASSGVPVLFPPTHILGDTLVDGGVADNQGLEALLEHERSKAGTAVGEVLLVSDASGQLEALNMISSSEAKVFGRVNDILQFQVRSKLVDLLVRWKGDGGLGLYFGFVHLFLNLKDRGVAARLPSEMIPAVARIRTDLDQFSLVEREALMYHGYTLIDAQIRQYCEPLTQAYPLSRAMPLAEPPLFSSRALATTASRDRLRKELEAGAQKLFLLRSLKKYPGRVAPVFLLWAVAWCASLWLLFARDTTPLVLTENWINGLLRGVTSGWVGVVLTWVLRYAGLQDQRWIGDISSVLAVMLATALVASVAGYVLAFPTYWLVRRLAMAADQRTYWKLTRTKQSTHWTVPEAAKEGSMGAGAH